MNVHPLILQNMANYKVQVSYLYNGVTQKYIAIHLPVFIATLECIDWPHGLIKKYYQTNFLMGMVVCDSN